MRSLIRRIEKLEARLLPTQPILGPATEGEIRFQDALQRLLERMEPNHRSLVVEDLKRCSETGDYRFSKFTFVVFHYVAEHLKANTPLELPGPVAAIYLQNPAVRPEHECADCGYGVPFDFAHPLAQPPRPVTAYFECCPVCAGSVGLSAFYFKHGYFKSHPPIPLEKTEKAAN